MNGGSEEKVKSAISSLKEVVTIVSGVTITHAIIILLTAGEYLKVKSINEISPDSFIFFVLLVINVIRFYHGNMRHLDDTYQLDSCSLEVKTIERRYLGLDFFVIFGQSVLFATMSFYLHSPTEFFSLFTILLFSDILWGRYTTHFVPNPEIFDHQKKWTDNNMLTVFALLFVSLIIFTKFYNLILNFYFYILALIIAINTIRDFQISWNFYFPTSSIMEKETVNVEKK